MYKRKERNKMEGCCDKGTFIQGTLGSEGLTESKSVEQKGNRCSFGS